MIYFLKFFKGLHVMGAIIIIIIIENDDDSMILITN
jgi:hypothetical protein